MSPIKMDRFEAALRVVIQYKDAFNRHDTASLLSLYREDCVLETGQAADGKGVVRGSGSIRAYWQDFFLRHPQAFLLVEESYNVDYRCVMQWTLKWHSAAGQEIQRRGVDLFKVMNGVIYEQLCYLKCPADSRGDV